MSEGAIGYYRYTKRIRPKVGDRVSYYVREGFSGSWHCGTVTEVRVTGRQPDELVHVKSGALGTTIVWARFLRALRNKSRASKGETPGCCLRDTVESAAEKETT